MQRTLRPAGEESGTREKGVLKVNAIHCTWPPGGYECLLSPYPGAPLHITAFPGCDGKHLIILSLCLTLPTQNDPLKKDLRKEETEGNIRKEKAGLKESFVSCFGKTLQEVQQPEFKGKIPT